MRRKESSHAYFVQRIPADVRGRAIGLRLALPVGPEIVPLVISPRMPAIKLSLRTRDPGQVKARQAAVAAYLENVWSGLRQTEPTSLSHRQATALAGVLYRAWADERRGRSYAVMIDTQTGAIERCDDETGEDEEWAAVVERWAALDGTDLEPHLGKLVDRLLLAKGVGLVDAKSRRLLLHAFWQALRDAFENRQRNAGGDYKPDPKAERFPSWEAPGGKRTDSPRDAGALSLTGLVEEWWTEAKASGLAISTYESYRNTMKRFVSFVGFDDALLVTPQDVVRFKDHRLTEVSAKTVKDNDLACLKAVFKRAVANGRLQTNPADGMTIKVGKKPRLRSKGFTASEAKAILSHAYGYKRNGRNGAEHPKMIAAKRWCPVLCAYSGARLGEIVQLRKQDIREEDGIWIMVITPEAGTVKTKEAREVPLHPHVIELGFLEFVEASANGYLFITPGEGGEVRGAWRAAKNRVTEFVREVVPDPNVAPNHGWRHLFKTIGYEAGIQERVLDAICGHAPKTVGGTYGEVTVRAKAAGMEKFPRFNFA